MREVLQASEEFVAGRHGIAWIGDEFSRHFGPLGFTPAGRPRLSEILLRRRMTDAEILAELKPGDCTLGDLFVHLHTLPQWPWSLSYIRDRHGDLRPVEWLQRDGEWYIDSRLNPEPWTEIYRVLGRRSVLRRFLEYFDYRR